MSNFKKVCVLMGGTSSEREVSLVSGKNVTEALASLGKYEVTSVVLDEDSVAAVPDCDACFLALHGGWGESGGVQAALDARGIPYTGPGAKASQIAMDKVKTYFAIKGIQLIVVPVFAKKRIKVHRNTQVFLSLVPGCDWRLEYVVKRSRARFKIGRTQLHGEPFDLVVSDPAGTSFPQTEVFARMMELVEGLKY